jgi:hypothetical protein
MQESTISRQIMPASSISGYALPESSFTSLERSPITCKFARLAASSEHPAFRQNGVGNVVVLLTGVLSLQRDRTPGKVKLHRGKRGAKPVFERREPEIFIPVTGRPCNAKSTEPAARSSVAVFEEHAVAHARSAAKGAFTFRCDWSCVT